MKEKKHFDLYVKYMKSGRIPEGGLCATLCRALPAGAVSEDEEEPPSIQWFKPPKKEFPDFYKTYCITGGYWGHSGEPHFLITEDLKYEFTPMRQTILLFLAAMNDEL